MLTRDRAFAATGAQVVHTLAEALARGRNAAGGDLVWITGGGQVYEQALPHADLLVVSELDLDVTTGRGDVVSAPGIDAAEWLVDDEASDAAWRPVSGDARWRVHVYRRR